MPSTVYKGDISEATFGHETGFTLEYDYHNGLRFSVQATAGDITTLRMTAGGGTGHFVEATTFFLRYPTGLLAGSKLRIKGGGALSADDHASNGHIYTIVDNYGTDILVTPALKTSAVTAATAGDALIIDSLGTPSIDVGMSYNAVAAASDETVLTDQFLGLAATLTFPETKAEIRRSHVIGIGRDVVVQEPQRFTNEGGSLEMMLNSPRWLYYGLGNEAVYGGITVKATCAGPAAKAISMGDTYIEFNTGTVSNAPALGDYILVVDTTPTKTPTDLVDASGSPWTQLQTRFDTTERNEMRRVICIDTTGAYTRIHVDDPFNFNHASLAATAFKVVTLLDDDTTGSPHFDTATATYGRIQNRQSRAIFSGYRTPSFSLETSMRTRDVDSYGHDGAVSPATYTGGQLSNVPDTASDSKQLTRIYKGCKVKEWTLTADADAEVKMSVAFDALMCYTDTGRLEDNTAATATLTVTDGDATGGFTAGQKIHIISTDGTKKDYYISDNNDGGPATGAVVTAGATLKSTGPVTAGALTDSDTTGVAIGLNFAADDQNDILLDLKAAIEHANGHNGKITVSAVPGSADGNQSITLTQAVPSGSTGFGNTTITENIANLAKTNFTGGAMKGDRYTAHRVFENIAIGSAERKIAGIAPNTEKPYFFYNGTISAFGMNIAQVTNFNLSGRNNTVTHFTIRGNPNAESRNTAGQSLEQVPFGGSRNPSLIVEGKVEYEMAMTIIVSDPLLWHEFRSNRTHNETEPIKLTLTKAGAGSNREELIVIVDDYIIAEAPLGIPEDKGVIKSELKIMPKHVKVVSHDALMHS